MSAGRDKNILKGVGLFGGTFNPVHLGHLKVAAEVKAGFDLERVCFIPSALPPHKGTGNLADAEDRYAMLSLAVSSTPYFEASDVEVKRRGRSFTIDTVTHYKNILSEGKPCCLIVGIDAFLEIDTWRSYTRLFDLIPFIVMTRPTHEFKEKEIFIKTVEEYLNRRVATGYAYSASSSCFVHDTRQPVFLFNVTPIHISSTQIRGLIRQGAPMGHLVPGAVGEYIQNKGLYR